MDMKKIKDIPFEKFQEESLVRWKIVVRTPIAVGERVLVVDFLSNEACTAYKREQQSFRVFCSKKCGEVKGITEEGKVSDAALKALYSHWNDYVVISEREEKMLSRFLKSCDTVNHQLDNLKRWVRETREKMKRMTREKRGELIDEDYRLCPETLPEGLIEYIRREILARDHTLLYKKGNVRGTCYRCGENVRAYSGDRFIQGKEMRCPNCGRTVCCVLESSKTFRADYVENVVAAQKGTDGKTVFFRQWMILRDPEAKYEHLEDFLKETVRYGIRGKKTAKWQKESKENYMYRSERYDLDDWTMWRDNRIYDNEYYFCPVGIEEALEGTAMKYADLKGYLEEERRSKNTIYFLEYHAKYPVIEFLWKAGYRGIVHNRIFGMCKENRDAILWQRGRLQDCFRFPLRFLKAIPPEEWTLEKVQRMNKLWERRKEQIRDQEVKIILRCGFDTTLIEKAMSYTSAVKIIGYIEKQTERRRQNFESRYKWERPEGIESVARAYRDYIRECEQLELELSQKEILFPKDLEAAHQRTAAQVSFEKNKADQEKFRKAVGRLERFVWESGGFLIRPAREQKELAEEGEALHHCVGGYIKDMADGKTAIFFVRKKEEPDKPLYTLELKGREVIQCRTDHNRSYQSDPAVKDFVDMWIDKIVSKGGNKKKNKEAAA